MEKPALCLVNKMDTDGAEEKLEEIMELLGKGYDEAVSEMDEDSRPRRRDAIQLRFWTCVPENIAFPPLPLIQNS